VLPFLEPQIGIVGAGDVGSGLAQICVQNGLQVLLIDDSEEALGNAEERVLKGLHRAEQPAAFSLLRKATRFDRVEECDLVVECATEDPAHTQDLLRRIDARLDRKKLLAVQTTAMPVHVVGRAVENPDRLVGLHFFNPAHHMKLVEVVHYEHADESAISKAITFAERIGKTAVRCKDSPGFIVNRLARPYIHTALGFIAQGRGTPASVDGALRSLGGFPAGPVEMVDFFGLEEDYAVAEIVYQFLDRPERLKPSALVYSLIGRSVLGRRHGSGFYLYGEAPTGSGNPLLRQLVENYDARPAKPAEILDNVLESVFREAHSLVAEGVAEPADIDTAVKLGLLWPKGPFEWEKERRG
jgi:3-hydroxybutyryl-CoA dehydrogenase